MVVSGSPSAFTSPLTHDANRDRVALVTGGGTGIGRAIARELARSGAGLVICGRRPEPLAAVRSELEAEGTDCLALPADIREPDQVESLVDAALERFGRIDILVNNAGGQFEAPAEAIPLKGWRAVHRLTVDAAWSLTHTVATRSMIPGGSGLVVFLGFSPRRGIPGFAHAAAARGGLEVLAAGLSLEWSRYGIRTVCVAVGNVLTDGLRGYGPEFVERSSRQVPLGRLGMPEEIASVIAFLASAGGAYVTGTTLVVDGGLDAWGAGEPPPSPRP
jgi:citronellol/citronellal dehydrogenase